MVCPGASRCLPIRHGTATDISGRALVSLRRVTEVGRQYTGVTRKQVQHGISQFNAMLAGVATLWSRWAPVSTT